MNWLFSAKQNRRKIFILIEGSSAYDPYPLEGAAALTWGTLWKLFAYGSSLSSEIVVPDEMLVWMTPLNTLDLPEDLWKGLGPGFARALYEDMNDRYMGREEFYYHHESIKGILTRIELTWGKA